jgi:hypothetical protein
MVGARYAGASRLRAAVPPRPARGVAARHSEYRPLPLALTGTRRAPLTMSTSSAGRPARLGTTRLRPLDYPSVACPSPGSDGRVVHPRGRSAAGVPPAAGSSPGGPAPCTIIMTIMTRLSYNSTTFRLLHGFFAVDFTHRPRQPGGRSPLREPRAADLLRRSSSPSTTEAHWPPDAANYRAIARELPADYPAPVHDAFSPRLAISSLSGARRLSGCALPQRP